MQADGGSRGPGRPWRARQAHSVPAALSLKHTPPPLASDAEALREIRLKGELATNLLTRITFRSPFPLEKEKNI